MKIKMIGTGNMWVKSNSASYLIDDKILIDAPNGSCKSLIRYDISPKNIEHILFTHFHGDHYFDIPFYFLQKSKSESLKLNIYCDKKGKTKIKKLFKLAFPNTVKKVGKILKTRYIFDTKFKIDNYDVEKVLVEHGGIKPAYGYIFKSDMTIGFTGDTCYCDSVVYMASTCDYLICDCNFLVGNNKHLGIDNIKLLAKEYPKCTFIVSHIPDEVRDGLETKDNIIVPTDGSEINI